MIDPSNDLIAQFLLSVLSKESLSLYGLMTHIKYPVEDKKTLVKQLDNISKDFDPDKSAVQRINAFLNPSDFPIMSLQSGLEKLQIKLPPGVVFNPDFFLPDIRDTVEVPERNTIATDYSTLFGFPCGQKAYEEFVRSIQARQPELVAFANGLAKGRQCVSEREG